MRIRSILFGLAILGSDALASNLGNILSLRLMTGRDGVEYIEIGHSSSTLYGPDDTKRWPSAIGQAWQNEVYIAKPVDDLTFNFTWSLLQKAMSCQCIQFYAAKGTGLNGMTNLVGNDPENTILVQEYWFVPRW